MKLIIPTRNRPNSLRSVLLYLEAFYPKVQVLVADGSIERVAERVRKVVEDLKSLDVQLRCYPYNLGIHERMLDSLESVDDDVVITCADDDYPLMDVLSEAGDRLCIDAEINAVIAASINLRRNVPGGLVESTLRLAQAYRHKSAVRRIRAYNRMHHFTFYGAIRRDYLIRKIRFFKGQFVAGFGDFEQAFFDVSHGKLDALPKIAYLRTDNENHSKLRGGSRILPEATALVEILARAESSLRSAGGSHEMSDDEIAMIADQALAKYIGYRSHRSAILERARETVFRQPEIVGQIASYDGLFQEGHIVRRSYIGHLRWAVVSLTDNNISEDNDGEPREYSSLDEMQR